MVGYGKAAPIVVTGNCQIVPTYSSRATEEPLIPALRRSSMPTSSLLTPQKDDSDE